MTKTITSIISLVVIVAVIIIIVTVAKPSTPLPTTGSASLSLLAPLSGMFDAGETQSVRWTSENYGSTDVKVNLIRKVSDNPARYELVRTIALKTKNDGSATWVPAFTDVGSNLSIEVGCAVSPQACTASSPSAQLAVTNTGRFSNTANAYQAIEQAENK